MTSAQKLGTHGLIEHGALRHKAPAIALGLFCFRRGAPYHTPVPAAFTRHTHNASAQRSALIAAGHIQENSNEHRARLGDLHPRHPRRVAGNSAAVMSDTENTVEKRSGWQSPETQFKPGNAGRPKGARNKLGEAFIEALQKDFDEHGIAAVQAVRSEKPDQYLKVIASLMPKEHRLSLNDQFTDMTDDELAERIRQLAATIAPFLDGGATDADEAVGGTQSPNLASRVH